MKQDVFVNRYQQTWQQLEAWLNYQEASSSRRKELEEPDIDVSRAYRQVCHYLALAQSRLYSSNLIDNLNRIVLRGHQALYSSREPFMQKIFSFLLGGFSRLVRQEWRLVALASLLFYGPFLAMLISIQFQPELVYTVVDPETVRMFESMYNPELRDRLGREHEADSDIYMFGYYIRNNTGIGFQTFSGGMLFSLGTLFFLIFNGFIIGAVAGHLTHLGYIDTFWGFVSGHSAMELTAIVLSGVAGLRLAAALVSPGRRSRSQALLENGKLAVQIVAGAGLMFILAAFIEAFWSSLVIVPVTVKYVVGVIMWVIVLGYFVFLGRRSAA